MGEAPAQIPTSFGHELRACLRCRLVKTYDQFRGSGCRNCPFFKMEDDHERFVDVTTPNFNASSKPMQKDLTVREILHNLCDGSTQKLGSKVVKNWEICSWLLHCCCLRGTPRGNAVQEERVPYIPPKRI